MSTIPKLVGASVLAGYTTLQILGRTAGSTTDERNARLPGDHLVDDPQLVTNHGETINAPAAQIWPWLSQMGWHLGGWYTPGWVDRLLFPENWPSIDRLDPNLVRDLEVGDTIPDGKPGTAHYVVEQVQAPQFLVLRSTTHIPPGWDHKFGVRFTWTWCFSLTELEHGMTRVHLRVRGHSDPWWFTLLYVGGLIPADFIMATGMLRGLKQRVEAGRPPVASGREPLPRAS